jgi:hypothetical protein
MPRPVEVPKTQANTICAGVKPHKVITFHSFLCQEIQVRLLELKEYLLLEELTE